MTQIPILNGIFTDEAPDFRTSYPRNYVPVPKKQGISNGYLRPAEGIVDFATGPGTDRGAINWDGICYRVMGTNLVSVNEDGSVTSIGFIAGTDQVTLHYSFVHLSITGGGRLYLYDKVTLIQITDPDLGVSIDHIWIDGVFMSTDGEFLVITDINDPFAVNPLKFGSSEIDPDPINGVLKLNNEAHALNRFTIEVFENTGGSGFNFQVIKGAQFSRGSVGTHTATIFMENLAFVGGALNESIAIWLGSNGRTVKISTREIDQILATFTEAQLSLAILETRVNENHQFLWLTLPDQTLVYDAAASIVMQTPVWHILTTSVVGFGQLRARNLVYVYDKWLVGDPTSSKVGVLDQTLSSHFGNVNGWDFGTIIGFNEGLGAIFHRVELVALTGRAVLGDDPIIFTSYSLDGETFSQEFAISAGKQGERNKRLAWFRQGHMQNWRIQKFRGTSDAQMAIARLDIELEGLGS